jgi:tetratricopeptide (TPR) repeat protein
MDNPCEKWNMAQYRLHVLRIAHNLIGMIKKLFILSTVVFLLISSCSKKEDIAYMGSRSCRECHENFYQLWNGSHHAQAMLDFTPEFAEEHLTQCEDFISVGRDAFKYQLSNGKGVMIQRSEHKSYPIRYVLGGKYVYYFLTPFEKGKLQTLPLGYDVKKKEWFDITASSVRIHQDMIDEALPWTDRQYTFNTACFSCHVSQLSTDYNINDDSYHTTWLEPGINCETCHGPAEKHNKAYQEAAKTGIEPDSFYVKTFTQSRGYSADIVNATCAYCHAKAISLTPEYVLGDDFFQHYDLVGPENSDYYPDGRDLGENYSYTSWLMSPCVRNSDMDCLHCHTSSGRFRQKDDPNASCLPCHAERVANATEHTHHKPASPGNLCINCHMPKTTFARMERSDHSMRPPVPAATIAYGSPNACNDCHSRKSPEWAESFIREHFSGKYQDEIMTWADYLDQLRNGEDEHLDDILPDLIRPLDEVTLSALIRSLQNVHDDRIVTLCYYFMNHDSPLVRSSAATVLADYDQAIVTEALCKACNDPVRLVRVRAAAGLLDVPEKDIPTEYSQAVTQAIEEYKNSLNTFPDQESSHFNLGHFHESQMNDRQAVVDYKRALKLRPEMTEASVNLGMLYYRNGYVDSALYYFQDAVIHDPRNAGANLNLGLLYSELGYTDEAIEALTVSYEEDKLPATAYNLAVLYAGDDPARSLDYARNAFDLSPQDPKYVYTYAFYLSENGKTIEAKAILESALERDLRSFDIYYLLGTIYKHSGENKALDKLKKMIAKDKELTERELRYLAF